MKQLGRIGLSMDDGQRFGLVLALVILPKREDDPKNDQNKDKDAEEPPEYIHQLLS